MARTYNQDCILAHALDLLGERWTFLILRDLFLGPQRFGDIQAALPGIGANLLSKRLKELEEAGLLEGPVPSQGRVRYRLTKDGDALRPVICSLMSWSVQYFMERQEPSPARDCIYSNNLQPDSVALAIELFARFNPEPDLNYVAHIFIDNFPYTLYHMNGELICRRGADTPAVATLKSDVATILQSFRHELTLDEAKSRMTLEGNQKALDHLLSCIVHTHKEEGNGVAKKMEAAV